MTKLSSALPDDQRNGLAAITRPLIDEPHRLRLVVGLVDCKQTTIDNDTGAIVPTARFRHVEAILDDTDAKAVTEILRRALEERTGQTALPLDEEP